MTTTPQTPTAERDAWERIATGFDEFVTPANMRLGADALHLAKLRPGERFLDVAAGSGALAIPAARLGADVVAVDFAPTLVERLGRRAREEGLADVQALVMDGCALEFDDDQFDVTGSQHGVSIFADLAGGLREMVRVTRPGGRVVLVAFGDPRKAEFLSFFIGALRALMPGFGGLPTDPPPLPFQLCAPGRLRDTLTAAGLDDVETHTVTWELRYASAEEYWNSITHSNPIGARLAAGLTQEQSAEARQVLDGMLRERSGGGPGAVLETEIHIGIGTKDQGRASRTTTPSS